MSLLSSMRANYVHLLWQAQLRCHVTMRLLTTVKRYLELECFPGEQFDVQVYASLHQGLFVPGSSKINIDVSLVGSTKVAHAHVLQVLTSHLQMLAWKTGHATEATLQHPVLVWNRSVSRPWLLVASWEGVPVQITCENIPGVRVSEFMMRALNDNPSLRLTLLHWKQCMRTQAGTQYLGPNAGQVSTYALFTILLSYMKELQTGVVTIQDFEDRARRFVVAYLSMVPKRVHTTDMISATSNLTSRSYLAAEMAQELVKMPGMVM